MNATLDQTEWPQGEATEEGARRGLIGALELASTRATVARLISSGELTWRRHGIGALQAYVAEGERTETRIHVWSPSLMLPGISESGSAHNHRFSMLSQVLTGRLIHTEWHITADEAGDHETYDFVNARQHTESNRADMRATGERFSVMATGFSFTAGHWYTFPRGAFHDSMPATDIVVTLVQKFDQRDVRAQVIAPRAIPPVPAFGGAPVDPAVVERLLEAAAERLLSYGLEAM